MRTTHLFIAAVAMLGLVACSDDTVKPPIDKSIKTEAVVPKTEGGVKKELGTTKEAGVKADGTVAAAKTCQCAVDGDCTAITGGFYKYCVNKACALCKADGDCAATTKGCNTATGGCKQCLVDADCVVSGANVGTGKCDTATFTCTKCAADGDCNYTGSVSKLCGSKNTCVFCKVDNDCTTGPKKCEKTIGVCETCAVDGDCTSGALKKCTAGFCMCGADAECNALYSGATALKCL